MRYATLDCQLHNKDICFKSLEEKLLFYQCLCDNRQTPNANHSTSIERTEQHTTNNSFTRRHCCIY